MKVSRGRKHSSYTVMSVEITLEFGTETMQEEQNGKYDNTLE